MTQQLTKDEFESMGKRYGYDAGLLVQKVMAESERAAVILGAARVDHDLQELLSHFMRPHSGKRDPLLDNDGPLSTFSAKITLSYRLGLIDDQFKHALEMLRRIRNLFAHHIDVVSLSDKASCSQFAELVDAANKHPLWDELHVAMTRTTASPQMSDFGTAIAIMLWMINLTREINERITIEHSCTFNPYSWVNS